jgi:parallel beta-helix repeat protein
VLAALVLAASIAASAGRAATTLVVDDDKVQCPGAAFTSIQAAVSAAAPGDTIRVCPGTYAATTINERDVTLVGDTGSLGMSPCLAGGGGTNAAADSIVNGGFTVAANGVEIRHFTVQGTAGPGIHVAGTLSGTTLRNNVIQGNTFGIYLNSNGVQPTRATGNCIRSNNAGGSASGNGVYSDQGLKKARIEGNVVTKHVNASIILVGKAGTQSDVRIANNRIVDDAAVILTNLTSSNVAGNLSRDSNGAGVFFGGGSSNVDVAGNVVEDCAFTGINVRFLPGTYDVSTNNTKLDIRGNRIVSCGDAGMRLRDGTTQNLVRGNTVRANGTTVESNGEGDGIALENADSNRVEGNVSVNNRDDGLFADSASSGNAIVGNTMDDNVVHDCHDDSSGSGTAGTANQWRGNRGETQNRPGLCRPGGDGDDGGPGNGKGQNKVAICHKGHTIRVAAPAVPAHLRHGDELGACDGDNDDRGENGKKDKKGKKKRTK